MGAATSMTLVQVTQLALSLLSDLGLDGLTWQPQVPLTGDLVFDYLVIGGGTAGSVVAKRLAEIPGKDVCVIEEGDDPPLEAILPGLFILLPRSHVDYDYKSTYNPYVGSAQNHRAQLTAGKMLGGSASLNHFLHLRGCPSDYDHWAKDLGDDTWTYKKLLKYFKKTERVDDEATMAKYAKYHGTDGPIGITVENRDDDVRDFLKSFAETGTRTVLDLNADIAIGYTKSQYIIANSIRQTPAYSYLYQAKNYTNLYVSKNTRVTKVIFNKNRAVGVTAIYKGKTYTFRARKEIILCAGAFNTPQILMLSGVGPANYLKPMHIDVKADLPVGENLVDHAVVILFHKTKRHLLPISSPLTIDLPRVPFPVLIGAVALNNSNTCPDYGSYVIFLNHDTKDLTFACKLLFGYRDDICNKLQAEAFLRDVMVSVMVHTNPKSRGTVRLNSLDPLKEPRIDINLLGDNNDLKDLLKFIKHFIKVGDTKYFKNMGAKLIGLNLPECKNKKAGSDEFWKCYIRSMTLSQYHSTGTCRLGDVVNSDLKVKGFSNLRIADASVIPNITRAGPTAAIMMIAEKLADLIKNDS